MPEAVVGGSGQCTWDQPIMPFVDFTAQGPTLYKHSGETGIKCFALGFVVATKTGFFSKKLSWGGFCDAEDGEYKRDEVKNFKEQIGGVPVISFGGQDNLLPDVVFEGDKLLQHYTKVIEVYDVNHIDFDIEGPDNEVQVVLDRHPTLVQSLLRVRPKLKMSYTFHVNIRDTVDASGVDDWSLTLLRKLAEVKVTPDLVNPMVMYMWRKPEDAWVSAKRVLEGTNKQLCDVYKFTETDAWCHIGCCPKYGDNGREMSSDWTLANQKSMRQFAQDKKLGCCSGWSTNEDDKIYHYAYEKTQP
jgi:chitinase